VIRPEDLREIRAAKKRPKVDCTARCIRLDLTPVLLDQLLSLPGRGPAIEHPEFLSNGGRCALNRAIGRLIILPFDGSPTPTMSPGEMEKEDSAKIRCRKKPRDLRAKDWPEMSRCMIAPYGGAPSHRAPCLITALLITEGGSHGTMIELTLEWSVVPWI
jgi:hypothetical protein